MKLTRRCARITHERATLLQKIIDALRVREMTREEIRVLLDMSESGCTKYIEDLNDNKIALKVKYRGSIPRIYCQYRLTSDEPRVAEFIRLITLPGLDGLPRHRGRNISPDDGMRKVHITTDDEPVKVKLGSKKPPKQFDPLLYLFGMNMEVA